MSSTLSQDPKESTPDLPRKRAQSWIAPGELVRPIGLFFVYTLLALWVTRPLIQHFDEAIPFGSTMRERALEELRPGDSTQLYYFLWLFKDNVQNGRSPVHSKDEFGPLNPENKHPLFLWGFPLQIPFSLLAWLLGATFAFNLLTLLTFPAAALAQYWFARVIGMAWKPAALTGFIFAFALSRRVQMFSGHANGHLYFHLPILCASLWLTVQKKSPAWAVLFGVTLLSIALGEWHCFYYSSLFVAPLFFFALWFYEGFKGSLRTLISRRGIAFCTVLCLFSGSAIGYAYYLKATVIEGSSASENRGLKRVKRASVSPGHLVSVKRYRTKDIWAGGDVEPSIYLGNYTLGGTGFALLSWLGLALYRRRNRNDDKDSDDDPKSLEITQTNRRKIALAFFFLFNAGLYTLLALGIRKDLPGLYEFLFDYLPFWSLSRVPVRIIYLAHFCLSLSLGLGFHAALELAAKIDFARSLKNMRASNVTRFFAGALTLCTILIAIDLAYRSPRLLLSRQFQAQGAVYERLQKMPISETGPLLFFPIYSADGSQNAAFQAVNTVLKRPFLNGYAPTAPLAAKEFFNAIRPMNKGVLSQKSHCLISKTGAQYLVKDTHAIRFLRSAKAKRNALQLLEKSGQLKLVQKDAFAELYKILPPKGECP